MLYYSPCRQAERREKTIKGTDRLLSVAVIVIILLSGSIQVLDTRGIFNLTHQSLKCNKIMNIKLISEWVHKLVVIFIIVVLAIIFQISELMGYTIIMVSSTVRRWHPGVDPESCRHLTTHYTTHNKSL